MLRETFSLLRAGTDAWFAWQRFALESMYILPKKKEDQTDDRKVIVLKTSSEEEEVAYSEYPPIKLHPHGRRHAVR